MSKNFILIGAAGYVAPRHLIAIKETGNKLISAYDPHDSVGILDSYFPQADFFTEFERFDRHIEKLKRQGVKIDFVSICSPNYLHDAHIRFGLRIGANIICEKPIVLNPWNVDALIELKNDYPGKIYSILQLRLHPSVIALKKRIESEPKDKIYQVKLDYITSRGNWYLHSWKGDMSKSGGIATNIGIHFFDMLIWVFGNVKESSVFQHDHYTATGKLILERAEVNWLLSIDENELPNKVKLAGERIFRSILIDNDLFSFSSGFTDLHTKSYKQIFDGKGFEIGESKKAIELVSEIRKS